MNPQIIRAGKAELETNDPALLQAFARQRLSSVLLAGAGVALGLALSLETGWLAIPLILLNTWLIVLHLGASRKVMLEAVGHIIEISHQVIKSKGV